jgi:SAM-dependent methyltransferase
MRRLDIGPGKYRLQGFETFDCAPGRGIDHVGDARRLPFKDATFDLVHASHVIEHIPWYQSLDVLREWVRVLRPGGALEVWTVNGYKVAKALVDYEETGQWNGPTLGPGTWRHDWITGNPVRYCAGRFFAYGRTDKPGDPNWHKALFTPSYLRRLFGYLALSNVREMDLSEIRAGRHPFVNFGVRGEMAP